MEEILCCTNICFWFFGHPEVYIIILPIFGIITKMISVVSNKPPFNPMSMIAAIFTISIVGFGVWAHHMFTTGLTVDSRSYFSAATAIIGVPTAIKVFSWISTI
jgi:cytochrome c oxidase subunit 1